MPKYCTAPNCKNGSSTTRSERKSFYKYPLHDPERLQLWLKNMGREDWVPSCHQFLCHKHFVPSCFTSRWGTRYLDNNAVPTIFDLPELNKKRKHADHFERRAQQQQTDVMEPQVTAAQSDEVAGPDNTVVYGCQPAPVKLIAITVKSSTPSEEVALPALSGNGNGRSALTPGSESAAAIPVTLLQTTGELVCCRDARRKVVVVREGPSSGGGEVCLDAAAHMIVDTEVGLDQQPHNRSCLAIVNAEGKDSTADRWGGEGQQGGEVRQGNEVQEGGAVPEGGEVQVLAYFKKIPSVPSPLSSMPMPAVLPGSCNRPLPSPGSLLLTLEKLVSVTVERLKKIEEAQQSSQLEDYRCHASSLSKEQLGAIVTELQKRVKVLQQRHRRHLDKLLGLEGVAAQLRQSSLLLEERLQLMEKAYLQTSAAVSDAGKTLSSVTAIIYEDDSPSYLWTQTDDNEEKLD